MGLLDKLAQILGSQTPKQSASEPEQPTATPPKKDPDSTADQVTISDLVGTYAEEAAQISHRNLYRRFKLEESQAGAKILSSPVDVQISCLLEAMKKLVSANSGFWSGGITGDVYGKASALKNLVSRLLRRNLSLNHDQLNELLVAAVRTKGISWELPWDSILGCVERVSGNNELTGELRENLIALKKHLSRTEYSENRKLVNRINVLLDAAESPRGVHLKSVDAWTDTLLKKLDSLPVEQRRAWTDLLNAASEATASKPPKRLLQHLAEKTRTIDPVSFRSVMREVIDSIGTRGPKDIPFHGYATTERTLVHDEFSVTLRGLIWSCIEIQDDSLIASIGAAAGRCYEKIRNIGPRAPKIGNACVYALSVMNSPVAISQLTKIRTGVKHASVRKQVEGAVGRAATEAGVSTRELEEMAVPTFGLTEVGVLRQQLGEFKAQLNVTKENSTNLTWKKENGKEQESIPKTVKDNFALELKKLKNSAKDIQRMLPAQRQRIERFLLYQPSWPFLIWRERYLDHLLLGVMCRQLIWRFSNGETSKLGICHEGRIVDELGRELDLPMEACTVQLWHPIESKPEVVLAWRIWIEEKKVVQPFKQAHREVYLITPAEQQTRTYSNRFAAHVLKQHQFSALCHERGWKYTLQGNWDSHNIPSIALPELDLKMEFWVDAMGNDLTGQTGVFLYISTDQVRFYRLGQQEPMRIDEVPPIVFSEMMRDVDLFVGVCSVGNDPNWNDAGPEGHRGYWVAYSFGDLSETAKTRKELLSRLLPRLKIADRCHIDGNFLVVRGDMRTYKIHLQSSNILMSPNDAYLCIVPGAEARSPGQERLVLPFDGDRTLSVILSKAFMLAEDKKIRDETILLQLRTR